MRLLFVVIATLLVLGGCFGGGGSVERTYYSLTYEIESTSGKRFAVPRFPFVLRVDRFDSALAYDKQEIVYRQNPYEYRYYPYRLWSAKPRKLLREMIATHLRRANVFSDVIVQMGDKLPEYSLEAEVLAVEELDAAADRWYAHLAIRFTLIRFSDNKQVWGFSFDEKRPVHERKPVFVVRELSTILETQLAKLVDGLDAFLARTHPEYPAPPLLKAVRPEVRPGATPDKPPTSPQKGAEPKARLIR